MDQQKGRAEYRRLVDQCLCGAKRRRCRPSRCYPEIYRGLYPRGGYYGRTKEIDTPLVPKDGLEAQKG
jgi:hypothetical protein